MTITPVDEHMTRCIIDHLLESPDTRPAPDPAWARREFKKGKQRGLFSEGQVRRIEAAAGGYERTERRTERKT